MNPDSLVYIHLFIVHLLSFFTHERIQTNLFRGIVMRSNSVFVFLNHKAAMLFKTMGHQVHYCLLARQLVILKV
jgi:hypothetical protein